MSLAKQIGSVAKTALTNAGHMSMNNEIYARILDTTVTALHLEALAPGYKECLDREAECVNRVTKSASTAQMEAKDEERDKILQFIYSMNGSYKVCPDETLRAPALLVDSVLRAYDKIYAKAYAEETALIDGLLLDLAKADVAEALKTLRLDTYVAQLKSLNDAYKALDITRTDEYAARVKTDTTKARKATDETLDLIIQRVNAFIDTVNQIFRKYKNLIAAKGGPTSPSKPDDKPYPTPDPTPDPENPGGDSESPDEI